jgi:HK97 gp10 family phage protein
MSEFDVQISGFPELDAALNELSLVAQRAVMVKAVRAGSEPLVAAFKANAPIATGNLQRQISTQLLNSQNTVDQVAMRIGPTKKGFYGSYRDRGTRFLRATHWFMLAFSQTLQAARDRMVDVLKQEIAKVKK